MKRHEQLLQAHFLDKEEAVIKRLRQVYGQSLKDATAKAEKLQKEFDEAAAIYDTIDDEAEKARLQSIMRSKVYQKKYQESLKGQMSDVLDKMHEKSYTTISQYLDECYTDGFVGAMQSLHKQGIPLAMPIDQKAMVRAVQLDSKISKGLYNHLGEDVATLKKRITAEVSRGISSGLTHEQVASNLAARMTGKYENSGGSMAYAMRIARTEGHRIQCEASFDAMVAAKAKGADIVKQWDSTLDGRTRESHQKLDGEIREVEEKFSNGLLYPGDSSGRAAEVVNCRCALMQRARAAMDEDELNTLKERAVFFGLDKADTFSEFKEKYMKATSSVADMMKATVKTAAFVPATTITEAEAAIQQYVDDSQFGAMGISYSGISVESANAVNEALYNLYNTYDLDKLGGVFVAKGNTKLGKQISGATAAYSPVRKTLLLNNNSLKNIDDVAKSKAEELRLIALYKENPSNLVFKTERARKTVEASLISGRATVADDIADAINHEMGHSIERAVAKSAQFDNIKANMPKYAASVSGYATTDMSEYIAESFTSYLKGEKVIDPDLKDVFESFKKGKTKLTVLSSDGGAKNLDKIGNSGIILSDKQFGHKIGKHTKEYGLDPSKKEDRDKMLNIITDIVENHEEVVKGEWRDQAGLSSFYIKGKDVVVVNAANEFVTILEGGVVKNARVKKARKRKIQ